MTADDLHFWYWLVHTVSFALYLYLHWRLFG